MEFHLPHNTVLGQARNVARIGAEPLPVFLCAACATLLKEPSWLGARWKLNPRESEGGSPKQGSELGEDRWADLFPPPSSIVYRDPRKRSLGQQVALRLSVKSAASALPNARPSFRDRMFPEQNSTSWASACPTCAASKRIVNSLPHHTARLLRAPRPLILCGDWAL